MDFRTKILKMLYRLSPFSLEGDLSLQETASDLQISCVINFYGRIDLLEGILFSLLLQDFPKEKFEVILVEDKGGTEHGRTIAERFSSTLNIRYHLLHDNFGMMGYSRNYGISKTLGHYILLLDDDTVILDKGFLAQLLKEFKLSGADAIMPRGGASFSVIKGKYDFHAPYFPTSRCMAYRRDLLRTLKGFVSDIIGQEDVEFVIRYLASGRRFVQSEALSYFHPPLLVHNLNKPAAVGMSFFNLKKRYPFFWWLMILINGSRHLPLLFFPFSKKWRMQSKFSLGFALGFVYAFVGRKATYQ
jgi:glycosyltransferase involved in cell wall biosynthesis